MFKSKKTILKENLKIMQERNKDLYERDIKRQEENRTLREKIAKLTIELEDTKGFLKQEKEAKEALLKERKTLKSKLTKALNLVKKYEGENNE